MKRLYVFLFFILMFILPMKAQETPVVHPLPKDSLPDLWVVTIDLSGSMTYKAMNLLIKDKVDTLMKAHHISSHDKVLLMHSGIDKTELYCSIEKNKTREYFRSPNKKTGKTPIWNFKEIVFTSTFIGKETKDVMNFSEAMSYLKLLCSNSSKFKYDLSFTALVRPLSMYVLTQEKMDFLNYRNIYHVLVTDNGDANDQWNMDYTTLKKYSGYHFDTVCKILPKVACSNFDFASKQTAKFEEIASNENQPRVYLTQYITYQDGHPETILPSSSLLNVSDYHNTVFTLSMNPRHDSVCFVYVDSCKVNEGSIRVGCYLYPGDTINIVYPDSFCKIFANEISAIGHYQEEYHDRILGQRYRTVEYGDKDDSQIANNLVAIETQAKGQQCFITLIALVLAIIIFITIWRNLIVLRIYANGQRWSIKRKAIKRMKNDFFTLLTLIFDDDNLVGTTFYKGKGIVVKDNDKTMKGDEKVLIKSYKSLSLLTDHQKFSFEDDKLRKNITIDSDSENVGNMFMFQYAGYLSHCLAINFEARESIIEMQSENQLRERNLQMLACYYEHNAKRIQSTRNNVMVNLIRKETMGEEYKEDYVVLNIFDLNSENSSNRLFLRYSLMCFFNRSATTESIATAEMLKVADYVLRSERQRKGYLETTAYSETANLKSGIRIDVSPLVSYLYLLKKGKNRMIYSPFTDGCLGLTSKTVKIFPKETMTLLNLPIKHKYPEMKKDDDITAMTIDKCFRDKDTLIFYGFDKVKFVNNKTMDYAYGRKGFDTNGITFLSWKLNDNIFNTIN